jgi:uncharacterized membrane protein
MRLNLLKPLDFLIIALSSGAAALIANLPLMLALDILPFGDFVLLALLKVVGQGLVTVNRA